MTRGVHDLGGLEAGPIDREEHDLELWHKRTDAMLVLLTQPKNRAFSIDALRRTIESSNAQDYESLGYYERWIGAVKELLVEQGVLTEAEIERQVDAVRARLGARGT